METNLLAIFLIILGLIVLSSCFISRESINQFLNKGPQSKIIFILAIFIIITSELLFHVLKISSFSFNIYFITVAIFFTLKFFHSKIYINTKVFSSLEIFFKKFPSTSIWLVLLAFDNIYSAGLMLIRNLT